MNIYRVFVPFALGYFLSYLLRVVNAVIAPDLIAELNLTAADLGLMTSANFLAFTIVQLPVGILLDRYGPRRTDAALLLFAGLGCFIFANATTAGGLIAGRALIGKYGPEPEISSAPPPATTRTSAVIDALTTNVLPVRYV